MSARTAVIYRNPKSAVRTGAVHADSTRDVPETTYDDSRSANGYALGAPARFGTRAAQQFNDTTGAPLWNTGDLTDEPVMDRDRELIGRFAKGDREAFSELMASTEDMVFAVCMRIMGDREAARDAAQETFVTLFRKADRYSGNAAVTTWLYRVTVNTCYDQLRKAKRRAFGSFPDQLDPADRQAEDPFAAVDLSGPLADALSQLPEEFKAAVILSDIEGLALAEVAEILEVPVGTVKSRVFRGRKLLAQELGDLMVDSGRPTDDRQVSSGPAL